MKKVLLFVLVVISIVLGYTLAGPLPYDAKDNISGLVREQKTPILRVALVTDSGGENDLLGRALAQAQGIGINSVIGLGDWTQVGTLDDLSAVKQVFDNSKLEYFVLSGDHDDWDSRNRGEEATSNFEQVFGEPTQVLDKNGVRIVLLDNSDIYKGISESDWKVLSDALSGDEKLKLVFVHKTPFHPSSAHIMGADSAVVASQAQNLTGLLEERKVSGLFTGDLHFFAKFKSPDGSVRITTIGAVASERNFQGPRFSILTVYSDYSWDVEDVEIR
ncbi:MAG: hypothetical protein NUV69_05800 [Candidatus Curtissbacteria bacterium]|nr:hypothetical protein [Candidatus Curtissbacteria bacterium]